MALYSVAPRSRRILAAHERSLRLATGNATQLRTPKLPHGTDACVILFPGERLLQGTLSSVEHQLRKPGIRTFVPVHYPVLPELSLDLIALEPRWFNAGPHKERIDFSYRIAAAETPDRMIWPSLHSATDLWAGLILAALEASTDNGTSLDRLRKLWSRENQPPMMRSLVLRNMIVLLITRGEHEKARELLNLGVQAFPEYAELRYLSGVHWTLLRKFSRAAADAQEAMRIGSSSEWVGSGGESTYRAHWILGMEAMEEGRLEVATNYFIYGLAARPAFRPSAEGLLDIRLPVRHAERLRLELCRLVRREPAYLNPVVEYLLLHRCFSAARRLADTLELPEETRAALHARTDAAETPFVPSVSPTGASGGVMLQGPFFQQTSLSRIVHALATGLMNQDGIDLVLEPSQFGTHKEREFAEGELMTAGMLRHPRQLDLTIRLCWPPDFQRPPRGRLACIFPWEYRGLPKYWIAQMRDNVDELWVPSRFVQNVLTDAGFPLDRVRVIPNGFDPAIFTPQGPSVQVPDACGFLFLFVGGAIARKGFDLLLDAYEEAFSGDDDVSLLIKESGSGSFYSHSSLLNLTKRFTQNSRMPHVIVSTAGMGDSKLAALYRCANCLVHPYRGEGFGMPLAESMACGTPVITTAEGPAAEFCSDETGWLIPATTKLVPDDPPPVGELSQPLAWFEPSFEELVRAMRQAYEQPNETAARGLRAAERIHRTHAWNRIISIYSNAVMELAGTGELQTA